MINESVRIPSGLETSLRESRRSSTSSNAFLFYDPYYEELLRRRQIYEARDIAKSEKDEAIHSKPKTDRSRVDSNRLPIPREASMTEAIQEKDNTVMLEEKVRILEGELAEARGQLKANERVINSLYSDLDRAKASVAECLEREARLAKELKRVSLNHENDSLTELKELEGKYLNAVRLIDELNWKLHKFPDNTLQ